MWVRRSTESMESAVTRPLTRGCCRCCITVVIFQTWRPWKEVLNSIPLKYTILNFSMLLGISSSNYFSGEYLWIFCGNSTTSVYFGKHLVVSFFVYLEQIVGFVGFLLELTRPAACTFVLDLVVRQLAYFVSTLFSYSTKCSVCIRDNVLLLAILA